jgi:hypothetical protein
VPVPDSFLQKLAKRLGVAPDGYDAFARNMQAWGAGEGNPSHAFFLNNPLATTQTFPDLKLSSQDVGYGPGRWNTAGDGGVKIYASEDAGVEATARMIENGNFPTLNKEIRTGTLTAASAPDVRRWGTTGFANQLDPSGGGGGVAAAGGDGTTGNDDWFAKYSGVFARWTKLDAQIGLYVDPNGKGINGATYQPGVGWVWSDALGKNQKTLMTEADYAELVSLDNTKTNMEDAYQQQGGDINAAIKNATDKYSREFDVRANAAQMANQQEQEQRANQQNAIGATTNWWAGKGPDFGMFPSPNPLSPDELFNRAVSKLKDGLPAIPDMPAGQPSLGEMRRSAAAAMPVIPPPLQPTPDVPAGVPGPAQSLPDFPRVNPPGAGAQWLGAQSLLPATVPPETASKRRTGSLLFGNPIYGTRPALPPLPSFYDRTGGR